MSRKAKRAHDVWTHSNSSWLGSNPTSALSDFLREVVDLTFPVIIPPGIPGDVVAQGKLANYLLEDVKRRMLTIALELDKVGRVD